LVFLDDSRLQASVVGFQALEEQRLDLGLIGPVRQLGVSVSPLQLLLLLGSPAPDLFLGYFSSTNGLEVLSVPLEIEVALDELGDAFRTGMSANVEILGDKRAKALSLPLEALQKRDGTTVAYVLKKDLDEKSIAKAKEGLSGRAKFVWLSENWKDYFNPVPVRAGIATLERVEILAGLSTGDKVCLEDPTRKKVEKDEDN